MTISLVGVGALTAGTTGSLTPALPAGIAAGDVVIVVCAAYNDASATFTATGSGYTPRTSQVCGSTAAGTLATIYKVAGVSETNPTVTDGHFAANGWACFCAAFRGVDNTTPFDVADVASDAFGGVNSITPTGLTTVTDGAWAVSVAACTNNETLSVATAQGFTTDASGAGYHNHPTPDVGLVLAHKLISAHGAVTEPTYSSIGGSGVPDSPSQWGAISFALRPSGGGGGGASEAIVMLV